ncbi:glucose-6-phosphate isomerase [Clostridium pasteurianum DSM 525 = ATCC 6013]|uniref:Glucose-6-phosphate isomerase n=1 Tax=Clostridium pasteurianum DSM 525 = ATCC 6013 TaxID=1262449 RepID=A0A0H3JBF9_CLOPA|nr:glucose-6-phosphate isomerase [Clostridium pasteurianum]AJA49660.1 glucose-6-phosphate isomerase [Clostridium pasteurianum DSM 525 = ATCC 6013]AJA53648.1 glucose-6-phosphate isomerase [Clostridium pasteurianum DSM 525 = ATCC 6013]AOZ76811.1 glucose-6-phosphate isomerase [Clostridium pasteurianum DSM 525 = ATCC 6013]AOZ80608.1 glucose-6-phosphate isomerase [Clostridium pasteurianum]ELP58825.1 glucose-6-phosphate isomerase [Clostridium pasteurianum DSM 525 = ATCC 6013]
MTKKLSLDLTKLDSFLNENEITYLQPMVTEAHNMLHSKTGQGNDFLGWIDLPVDYNKEEFERIKKSAEKIRNDSDVLIVIGIGGSYLGARAAIETLSHTFYNTISKDKRKSPNVFFVGNNISSTYMVDLLETIEGKDISVNVISKSGTTTEPAIAFRIFKDYLEKKYGKNGAKERIYATTDKEKGALKSLADAEGYETFVIPDDVGGRFSVLTPVGLLPIATAGINIDELMKGAAAGREAYSSPKLEENDAYRYAAARNALYRKGKTTEILVNYEPSLHYFGEWWKQLYGESEGKDGKGIFPAAVDFSTDLHSMGQYIQQGMRNIYETVINVETPRKNIIIEKSDENIDGLNFLAGQTMDYVNKRAFEGTVLAHNDGGVPNIVVNVPELTDYYFGYLLYFFEKSCGVSGYLLGINPFDQPGVEEYKKNMFALLGKPGYESKKEELEKRLGK